MLFWIAVTAAALASPAATLLTLWLSPMSRENPRQYKMVAPWIDECITCGNVGEGYPFPILYPKNGSLLTTRHLCLKCWHEATRDDHAEPAAR